MAHCERFGATLTNHFVTKYQHISKATAYIKQHRWTRYAVDGKPHNHSFIQDGRELRTAKVQKLKLVHLLLNLVLRILLF